MTDKPLGPAARIKKFCATPGFPVSIQEMKEFMAACKADDVKVGEPAGTTISRLAADIPS